MRQRAHPRDFFHPAIFEERAGPPRDFFIARFLKRELAHRVIFLYRAIFFIARFFKRERAAQRTGHSAPSLLHRGLLKT